MCMRRPTKFEVRIALAVPEIIGVPYSKKIWVDPGYAYAAFFPKFLMAFCSVDPVNKSAKFEVRSFTCF